MLLKRFSLLTAMILSTAVYSQSPNGPQLSAADKIAINTLEKAKQDAMNAYNEAQKAEAQIRDEWNKAHPGYNLNPQTFTVEPVAPTRNENMPAPKGAPRQ
jgi:hypothetical protein